MTSASLLKTAEDGPVAVYRPDGASEIVLVCEHAASRLPASLGDLGLAAEALRSHIAWDIGALAVSEALSGALDATLVAQTYSRLAYDCNRPPESPAAIPETSEIYEVPGNRGLNEAARRQRADALYHPFHAAIEAVLDARRDQGRSTILVTVHSFTPVYFGAPRDGELGILHDTDSLFADALLQAAEADGLAGVRRNYPYSAADGVTHTLQRHGLTRDIPNVMLEIRNDLVKDAGGQMEWAGRIAKLLQAAMTAQAPGQGGRRHA